MPDVASLGELLVDFTVAGESGKGNLLFEANPGGAPCNVLAMLARMGRKTTFLGKVGDDLFGRLLRDTIVDVGIDAAGLVLDPAAHTTLAFVRNAPDGDREFSFYRDPGADELLRPDELAMEQLTAAKIFHFGSLSLTREPVRSATKLAVETAKNAGALISFDPNLRESLWPTLDDAKAQMLWGCGVCDILKVAEEELTFLTGCDDLDAGADALRADYPNLRLLLVTQGKAGSVAFCGPYRAAAETFLQVPAVDTTGAGDTFCGCCLDAVLRLGLDGLNETTLVEMLRFANAAASLVTSKPGAIRSMPAPEDVQALLNGEVAS
jgi:fructokinase